MMSFLTVPVIPIFFPESVGSAIACPFSVKQETDAAPHTAATDQAPTMAVYG